MSMRTKSVFFLGVLLCVFQLSNCSQPSNELQITHVKSRVHIPQNGMNVIDFIEAEKLLKTNSNYFENMKFNNQEYIQKFEQLLHHDGMYMELPIDWYENFYQKSMPQGSRFLYSDIDSDILDFYFPSHLINVSYRVVINNTDTIYIGKDFDPCTFDILLFNKTYFFTRNDFYEEFDSLFNEMKRLHL